MDLHVAAIRNDADAAVAALSTHPPDRTIGPALSAACQRGHHGVVWAIAEHLQAHHAPAVWKPVVQAGLLSAIAAGRLAVVRYLLTHGADVHGWTEPPRNYTCHCVLDPAVSLACRDVRQFRRVFAALEEAGLDGRRLAHPHTGQSTTALLQLVSRPTAPMEAVAAFLRIGLPVNEPTDRSPLLTALESAPPAVARQLLVAGANPLATLRGANALQAFAKQCEKDPGLLRMLVDAGVNINGGKPEQHVLLRAVRSRFGALDRVALLLEHGAAVSAMNMQLAAMFVQPWPAADVQKLRDLVTLYDRWPQRRRVLHVLQCVQDRLWSGAGRVVGDVGVCQALTWRRVGRLRGGGSAELVEPFGRDVVSFLGATATTLHLHE